MERKYQAMHEDSLSGLSNSDLLLSDSDYLNHDTLEEKNGDYINTLTYRWKLAN